MEYRYFRILILIIAFSQYGKSYAFSLNGNWVVTKCISSEITFTSVGIDEIKRNLGCYITFNNEKIVENIGGSKPIAFRLDIRFNREKTILHFQESPETIKYINYKQDSMTIAYSNKKTYLREFYVLSENEILISVDGFYLFLNRSITDKTAKITANRLNFYTDNSFLSKFRYYAIKGEQVKVLYNSLDACFIKYSNKGKDYYGWIHSNEIK